jgi:riboflavin synthase
VFTGLVEGVGTVTATDRLGELLRLGVDLGDLQDGVRIGDSISISGACLTVVELTGNVAAFDLVPETLDRTTLGGLSMGSSVNIERALRVGDRLGGHFVQGHVDGTGEVVALTREGESAILRVTCVTELVRQMIPKGSISIDGVSLTIAGLHDDGFHIALVPHTLDVTTLGARAPGDVVNIELDMLGKYVVRLLGDTGIVQSS